jgi:hypothetical protein
MNYKNTVIVTLFIFIGLLIQSCATSGETSKNSGDSRVYNSSYNQMVTIVEKAIRGSNMNIDLVNKSENENKMRLVVSRDRYVGNEEVQQEQGEVRIIGEADNKTRVEIDNPEYHFSVPEYQREDYQRILFLRIDDIMDK